MEDKDVVAQTTGRGKILLIGGGMATIVSLIGGIVLYKHRKNLTKNSQSKP